MVSEPVPVARPRTVALFGLDFSAVTPDQAVRLLVHDAQSRVRGLVITPNVDHVVLLQSSPSLQSVYRGARWLFADGMPIVWLSRLCRQAGLPARVTGADLFIHMCAAAAGAGLRIFLLGAAPGVAADAARTLERSHPGLVIAGTYSPPRGFENSPVETAQAVDLCNAARPDIVFVGLGTPKQELWAAANMDRLAVGPVVCVGGAFDFVAGRTVRAPRFVQSVGLEWAWRLAHEPKRLWKRYLVQDVRFISVALQEMIAILRQRSTA